jgi:hypothetical protein
MYKERGMSTNTIVPIGCVTSNYSKDSGFIPFSELVSPVKSVEECIQKADQFGNLCAENNLGDNNSKCTYVAYHDGDVYDLLRGADSEYQKSITCLSDNEKTKYLQNSLQMFQNIWLHFTVDDRKQQLSDTNGVPFMHGYAPWIKKNTDYMTFFNNNVNSARVPIQMNNICWIGGNNVLKTGYTQLIDFDKTNVKPPACKYGLYIVPGTEGANAADRMKKYYKQLANDNLQKAKDAEIQAKKANAMLSFMDNSKDVDVFTLFNNAKETSTKIERDAATQDLRTTIDNNLKELQKQEKYIEMINSLKDTSKKAINSNIDLVKDQQHVADKMESDLQTLSWSLEESKNKEILQNKITTTLGIIIMLFAGLCIGLMVYYLIGGSEKLYGKTNVKNKSDAGVLDSIFGFNKINKQSSNKKAINSLFS